MYEAIWTGSWPNLCSGMWLLYCDSKLVDTDIPFVNDPADTRGAYSFWTFGPDWDEVWESYEDGMDCAEWCDHHAEWLATFAPREEWPEIYKAFQKWDWRHQSCGGCI